MKSKKILSTLISFSMLLTMLVLPETANATAKAYDTTILACTDFQNLTSDQYGASNVTSIINAIKNDGFSSANGFFCCGDYNNQYSKTEASLNLLKQTVIGFVPEEKNHVYVQGNHDAKIGTQGMSPSGNNDPESGKYGVFVINEDDYMWHNSDRIRIKETAQNLTEYLNQKLEQGYTKPIFVLSHLSLNKTLRTTNSGDNQYANLLFYILNKAGEQGLNIIFLHGHDHSGGYETYLGGSSVYLPKGDSINIPQDNTNDFKSETLNFTYMNAGYVGYYTKYTGADTTLTMTVFGINDDKVDIYRYDAGGLHNLKSKGVAKSDEESSYSANETVYTSPQTVTLTGINSYEPLVSTEFLSYFEDFTDTPDWTNGPWFKVNNSSDIVNGALQISAGASVKFKPIQISLAYPGTYKISMKVKPATSGASSGTFANIYIDANNDLNLFSINGADRSISLLGSKSTNATTYNSILNGDFTGLVYVWDTKLGALKATITKGNTELFSASATFAGNGTADVGDIIIEAIGRAFTIDDIEVKKATQMNLKFDSIKGVIQLPELVYIDDELTLIAEANDGYRFRKWSKNGNLVSNNLEYTFVARNSLDLDCIFDISPLIYSENFNYMSQDDWTNSDDYNPWKHWGDDTKLSLNAIQVQQGKTVVLDLSYFGLKTGKTYKISYDTYFNYNKYSGTDSIARKTLLGDVMLTYQDKDGYVYHGTKQTK